MQDTTIKEIDESELSKEVDLPKNTIDYDVNSIIKNHSILRIMSPHFVNKNDAKRFEKRVVLDVEDLEDGQSY